MDKFANQFFSMRMMAVAMIIFFVAIGGATFLESAYDTQTSKLYIYNAMWFNLLLTYLALNLIANIMRHRMIQLKKWAVLLFHVSFIVILIGAAVTRFAAFEGMMVIPEGGQANFIYSSNPHISYRITDKVQQLTNDYPKFLSEWDMWNDFELSENFPGRKGEITMEYVAYHKNMVDSLVTNDSIKESALELVHLGESRFIPENGFLPLDDVAFSFNKKNAMPGVEFYSSGNKVNMKVMMPGGTSLPMATLQAADRTTGVPDSLYKAIPMDTLLTLETSTLYKVGQAQFVFKGIKKHTKLLRIKSEEKDAGLDDLVVKVTHEGKEKTVTLTGGISSIPAPVSFELNGLTYDMTYGPKLIEVPFQVGCIDFRLDRYPGSNVASSYESDLEIIDTSRNYNHKQTVFMNNVMDYRGYRFFQSSYFPDEKGTKLSVNYDAVGTNITYIGYLLMALGMVVSLFMKEGRMRELVRKLGKLNERKENIYNSTLALVLLFSMTAFGQETMPVEDHTGHDHSVDDHSGHDHSMDDHSGHDHSNAEMMVLDSNGIPAQKAQAPKAQSNPKPAANRVTVHRYMSKEVSDETASLLVYDFKNRIIPFHTFADQILRKVYRASTYEDHDAVQTIVSMHMYPDHWIRQDVIYIDSKGGIRDRFDGRSHVSWIDLTDTLTGDFLLYAEYEKSHQKKESERNEFDKKLLKIAERYAVLGDVVSWKRMKLIPSTTDPLRAWFVPLSQELTGVDTTGSLLALRYFTAVDRSEELKSDVDALRLLKDLKEYQRSIAGDDCPTEADVNMEIRYNKMNIFHNAQYMYALIGFVLLIVFFIGIFIRPTQTSKKVFKAIGLMLIGILAITFLYHGYGVYMRAMITGYAPWSNGYEALVFIGLVAMFTGFFLFKRYPVVTAGAAILAFLMLFVADMNLLDPEITPMQPVLKSYWLMIHVAIITGSYAPLGIACILSFLALILYIFRNNKNAKVLNINISELTFISEIFMTIGVFMLTIGTFLGGVWANESWGRYWGWDPKETWALVAVLVYAVILHLRYIPGLKSKFVLNTVAFWGYSSIIFTFFGVNFYLVGLHSYAQGDSMAAVPMWIKMTVLFFALFTAFAAYRNWNFKKKNTKNDATLES